MAKTCGRCRHWVYFGCTVNLPYWAIDSYDTQPWYVSSDNDRAECCDCYEPRESEPRTE